MELHRQWLDEVRRAVLSLCSFAALLSWLLSSGQQGGDAGAVHQLFHIADVLTVHVLVGIVDSGDHSKEHQQPQEQREASAHTRPLGGGSFYNGLALHHGAALGVSAVMLEGFFLPQVQGLYWPACRSVNWLSTSGTEVDKNDWVFFFWDHLNNNYFVG